MNDYICYLDVQPAGVNCFFVLLSAVLVTLVATRTCLFIGFRLITHICSTENKLTKKRREGYLAAISRSDLTDKINYEWLDLFQALCFRQASLPAWQNKSRLAPTLNLGHFKNCISLVPLLKQGTKEQSEEEYTTEVVQSWMAELIEYGQGYE